MSTTQINNEIKSATNFDVWPIDRLIPYACNLRTFSDEQVVQIAALIAEFACNVPIPVECSAGITAGNGQPTAGAVRQRTLR